MEGKKDDAEKTRMDLFDPSAMEELGKVLTFGSKKYAPWNWTKGILFSRLIGALLRHTFAFMSGETYDPETGLHHMAHTMCCCMFILGLTKRKPECDDRCPT
jgi:Domain of unknown function (DUF5664)